MATLIRLKRKKSSGNNGVVLTAGEAYYNLADKRLYVGNTDNDDISSVSKKHIAQITAIEAGATTVKFQLGEDESNVYEKTITAEAIEGTIENAKNAQNLTSTIAGTPLSNLFNMSGGKPTSVKSATSATSATNATNYYKNGKQTSIASSFEDVTDSIDDIAADLSTSKATLQQNIATLSSTVDSNKTTTDATIDKIVSGVTKVAKAQTADNAALAEDLKDLSISADGAVITMTWGPDGAKKTKTATITADKISGVIDTARNVTEEINGTKITDIFSGTVAKKAAKLNVPHSLTTTLNSTASGEFDGSADVNIGVSGTLPLANGGTGSTTAAGALQNLGVQVPAKEINLLSGVKSNIQAQLDSKQPTIVGGATSITNTDLTANRALISDANGKVSVSSTTALEIGYISGAKSNIQNQLDGKAAKTHGTHVPSVETANVKRFLRNDNTWQTVTPENIGAALATHNHDTVYAPIDHTHDTSHNHDTEYSKLNHTHNYAGAATPGGSATSAVKLDTATAGDSSTPVYFSEGKPVACTSLDLDTTGNAGTATKLKTARTITLSGDVTGSASFDGSAAITITTDVSALEWKSF